METIIKKLVKKGYKRKKITIISYLLLLSLIILLLIIFIPNFIIQIESFINALPTLIDDLNKILNKIGITFNGSDLINSLEINLNKLVTYFSDIFNFFITISIGVSGAFFISYDYDNIKIKIKEFIPNIIKEETIYFFNRYLPFFSKYIYSLIIDSIITFVISFILFVIFGIEYSLIGALIIAITNLIPFIGPLLAIIPLSLIGYSISTYFAITSIVIVILVQLVESNIIQPLIFKNVIKLHPLEGLIGILLFSYLFGAIGMIFSPLLVVAFKILFIEKYNKQKVTL
jgi:predicted PurR-regulated permease PerM